MGDANRARLELGSRSVKDLGDHTQAFDELRPAAIQYTKSSGILSSVLDRLEA
jgi:type II secretory pathway component PulF